MSLLIALIVALTLQAEPTPGGVVLRGIGGEPGAAPRVRVDAPPNMEIVGVLTGDGVTCSGWRRWVSCDLPPAEAWGLVVLLDGAPSCAGGGLVRAWARVGESEAQTTAWVATERRACVYLPGVHL